MSTSYGSVAISLVGLMSAACGDGAMRESESPLPEWSLGEPEVVLGALDDGPTAFSRIGAVSLGPGAELHVLLPQDHQVRVFTRDGDFVRAIGEEGDGPGEFRRPSELGFVGDTLWILDDGARRASFFLDGTFLRVAPYPEMGDLHDERLGSVEAVLTGPSLLIATDIRIPFQPKVTTRPGTLFRHANGRFEPLAMIGVDHVGGYMIKGTPSDIEAVSVFRQPFSAASLWSVSHDGAKLTVVDRVEAASGVAAAYSVTLLSPHGDTLAAATFEYDPISLPSALVDSLLSPYVGAPFSLSDVREAAYVPESFPPVSDVVTSADGSVWLAREELPDLGREWRVISGRGDLVASLRTPAGYAIRVVEENDVWGLVTDELDVPYLVRRPIVRF